MSATRWKREIAAASAPWLLLSLAAFGVVIGGTTAAGTAAQRRYDLALSRHVVARAALQQLSPGVLDLQDALQSSEPGGSGELGFRLASLDAALGRFDAMPPLPGEASELAAARNAYQTWRAQYALPTIAALRGELRLAPNVTTDGARNSGARQATASVRALQALAATDDRVRGAQMAADFERFDRTNAALEGIAALGIAGAMAAGYAAIRRMAAQTERALLLEALPPLADNLTPRPEPPAAAASTPSSAFAFDDGGYAGYPVMTVPTAGDQPVFLYPVPFSLPPAPLPADPAS
ncbi:MAG: hypothetical protein HYX53_07985 [Chloroflexi bacterium]|nr:hypothetical protein [Chloroflexota bacterium]